MSNTMLLPQRIDALIDELVAVRNLIEQQGVPAPAEPEVVQVSDAEVSLNVSGEDDLHITNPDLFQKMAKYYDPEKQPFNSTTWFTTAWSGKDVRPLKTVWIDGVEHRRQYPQTMPSNDWYWVMRGCRDVTAAIWEFPILPEGAKRDRELELNYAANYEGGLRYPTDNWPKHLRDAYES